MGHAHACMHHAGMLASHAPHASPPHLVIAEPWVEAQSASGGSASSLHASDSLISPDSSSSRMLSTESNLPEGQTVMESKPYEEAVQR